MEKISYYKSLLLLMVIFIIGCTPQREGIPNLEDRLNNFLNYGSPILLAGDPFTGILYQEYDNGQIYIELEVAQGKPHGAFESYFENGQLYIKVTFKDGKQVGPFEEYYENGQLSRKGTYKNGKEDGLYKEYYANGQLSGRITLKDAIRDGQIELFYKNGQLMEKGAYKDGEIDGQLETYYENGQLYKEITFKDGKKLGPYKEYYENGQLKESGTLKGEAREGEWEYYYENGQMVEVSEGEVFNPRTFKIWMDRNLGASRVAKSTDDSESYGNYFRFEEAQSACPNGYRLPTELEWEDERGSWSNNNAAGAYASPLKLLRAGKYSTVVEGPSNTRIRRSSSVGSRGYYWSSTSVSDSRAKFLRFEFSRAGVTSSWSSTGLSVRCIKN